MRTPMVVIVGAVLISACAPAAPAALTPPPTAEDVNSPVPTVTPLSTALSFGGAWSDDGSSVIYGRAEDDWPPSLVVYDLGSGTSIEQPPHSGYYGDGVWRRSGR